MADKMTFEYYDGPQRSPEWYAIRRGRIGASRLEDWLSVSKAAKTLGKPLKARLDYEKELMFERTFNTSFEYYVNSAMQEGIDYEDFARKQYELITGNTCYEVGCWYSDVFVASPDRAVKEGDTDEGLLEIKILKDNSFTDVLINGVPPKHWKQVQGQLFSSKKKWCDYVAVNFNTKKVVIIRVLPDLEFHDYLELALREDLVTEEFAITNVHDIVGEIPEGVELGVRSDRSDSNLTGGW
jgi:hypothetical protein